MATIRDHVRGNLGETYDKLTQEGAWDGKDKPDIVGDKIAVVAARWLPPGADPEAQNEYVKGTLADMATRLLIPVAVDYYMVQTRLVDNASRPAGVTPLGGEVGQNYNRVDALLRLDTVLDRRIAVDLQTFLNQVGIVGSYGARTSGDGFTNTEDPRDFERVRGGRWLYPGYGVGVYVVPEQGT